MDNLGTLDLEKEPVANSPKNTSSSLFSFLEAAESDGLTPGRDDLRRHRADGDFA